MHCTVFLYTCIYISTYIALYAYICSSAGCSMNKLCEQESSGILRCPPMTSIKVILISNFLVFEDSFTSLLLLHPAAERGSGWSYCLLFYLKDMTLPGRLSSPYYIFSVGIFLAWIGSTQIATST